MILSYVYTVILVILSLVIQAHPSFDVIRIAGIKPDLLFILIVYLGYSFGPIYGQLTGFAAGLLHDSVSNSPLGLLTLPKLAAGFAVGLIGRSVLKSNIAAIILLLFVSTIIKGIITLFLSYIFYHGTLSSIIHLIIPESFYNAILAPLLFFLFDKIYHSQLEKEGY